MATSLVTLISHPPAIRERIRQLSNELKLARKMLAIAVRARAGVEAASATPRKAVRA